MKNFDVEKPRQPPPNADYNNDLKKKLIENAMAVTITVRHIFRKRTTHDFSSLEVKGNRADECTSQMELYLPTRRYPDCCNRTAWTQRKCDNRALIMRYDSAVSVGEVVQPEICCYHRRKD